MDLLRVLGLTGIALLHCSRCKSYLTRFTKSSIVSSMKLGKVIRKYRVTSELSLRDVGSEIGIGAATLMRLEQCREPDGATLTRVLMWLLRTEKPAINGTKRRKNNVGT